MTAYADRIARLQECLRADHLAAAVLAPTDHMRYLSGWAESGHERFLALLVPAEGEPVFVVPTINAAQARTNSAGIADVREWGDVGGWRQTAGEVLDAWSVNGCSLAIDDELHSVHLLDIQRLVPSARCVAAGAVMQRLREIKTAEEIQRMERSAEVTDAVYAECVAALREGMTEEDLQEVIGQAYKARGTKPAFAIVCFGANSALPHHHSGATPLKRGDIVLVDIGCILADYNSDLTRTLAFGTPDPLAFDVYRIVHAAHRAAFEAGRPGVTGEQVDRAARQVIEQAGYGEYFIHRTGHGIGMSGHEPPDLKTGEVRPLREGMCFSDEPGIYLPDRFGVRIENVVTVTADGFRSLNAAPPAELPVIDP